MHAHSTLKLFKLCSKDICIMYVCMGALWVTAMVSPGGWIFIIVKNPEPTWTFLFAVVWIYLFGLFSRRAPSALSLYFTHLGSLSPPAARPHLCWYFKPQSRSPLSSSPHEVRWKPQYRRGKWKCDYTVLRVRFRVPFRGIARLHCNSQKR